MESVCPRLVLAVACLVGCVDAPPPEATTPPAAHRSEAAEVTDAPVAPVSTAARSSEDAASPVPPDEAVAEAAPGPADPVPPTAPVVVEPAPPVPEASPAAAHAKPEASLEPPPETTSPEPSPPDADPQPGAPPEPVPRPARSYALTGSSVLRVLVFKDPDTLGAGLSHDHVVQAGSLSGSLTLDPDGPVPCAVSVDVPVAKLVVDAPAARRAVGLEGTLSDKQRAEVQSNMLSKKQLWGSAHPHIRFRSTGCTQVDPQTLKVAGTLSVRGKGAPVAVTLSMANSGEEVVASGAFSAKATSFGFQPYSALGGTLKNKNTMKFKVRLVGR